MTYKNLDIKQGVSWSIPVQLQDGLGNSLNLTPYSFECILKKAYTSKYYNEIHVTVDDAAAGTITLSLTDEETAALKSGRYVYTLRAYIPNQDTSEIPLDGIITVEASSIKESAG